ncbi:MAG: pilus assembly protein PilP [Bdellovibrio sp.]
MKSVRWMVSYIIVALLGLWLAFAVSVRFMAPAHSQDAPPSGDLPADFMKEVESTQVPPSAAPPPSEAQGRLPPPPQNGGSEVPPPPPVDANGTPLPDMPPPAESMPAQQPLPPASGSSVMGEEEPIGDGMTAPPPAQTTEFFPKDDFIYDPTGKRDPFKPFRTMRGGPDSARANEVLEPLQRWEIERLQVVGILWDVKTPRAMVRDPEGKVFTVLRNSKIGRNEGFVAAIREGEIVIVETRYDEGKPLKETRVMEFRK